MSDVKLFPTRKRSNGSLRNVAGYQLPIQRLREHLASAAREGAVCVVVGLEHPGTSTYAWSLFRTLHDSGELEAGAAVLKRDLLWLLDRDVATLAANQRTLRKYVAQAIKKTG